MAEIDKFFRFMQKQGASDLHIRTGLRPMLRIHGTMVPINVPPLDANDTNKLLTEITPDRNWKEFLDCGDTDFSYEVQDCARFRANLLRHQPGESIGAVFRIIPTKILSADDLGLPGAIKNLCMLPKGLVLVTGPTGSGKSTTLAAMIDYCNENRKDHIVTIEDPIEFVHPTKNCLITQREVHRHTMSFSRALRGALRQDPNVVLVGEMRDLETTHIAIETAETGHLVFGTLHTTTASSTVDRIIDQFPPEQQEQIRQQLGSALKGVVSQTLLKKKDGKGRCAALEIMIVNSAISNLIREAKTFQIPSSIQVGAREGMCLLNDALLKLVADGLADPGEAMSKAIDKVDLQNKIRIAFEKSGVSGVSDTKTKGGR
ncbi:MAG: type IV pilus twitching motility protein PilT [Planctomycetes bacterium]|nr:type IV pilus twitching motility protein PilT [Planctomycetota bacterium]